MLPERKIIRLKNYDYSSAGGYFVTICTQNRKCLFGKIRAGQMMLNDIGQMICEKWEWLAKQYDYVELDEWVIMPNHMHGIIVITNRRGGSRTAPKKKRKPLGRLIGAFKTVTTKQINQIQATPGKKLWQRSYYEHVIRNENELDLVRKYIVDNPLQWESDRENPSKGGSRTAPTFRDFKTRQGL
jgi:REP element-mobilizing transposase RayT